MQRSNLLATLNSNKKIKLIGKAEGFNNTLLYSLLKEVERQTQYNIGVYKAELITSDWHVNYTTHTVAPG